MSSVTRPDAATGTGPGRRRLAPAAPIRTASDRCADRRCFDGSARRRRCWPPRWKMSRRSSAPPGSRRPCWGRMPPANTLTGAARSWAGGAADRALIVLGDPRYRRLLDLPDPPLLLYCRGDWRQLAATQVAIVGSRNATALGQRTDRPGRGAGRRWRDRDQRTRRGHRPGSPSGRPRCGRPDHRRGRHRDRPGLPVAPSAPRRAHRRQRRPGR